MYVRICLPILLAAIAVAVAVAGAEPQNVRVSSLEGHCHTEGEVNRCSGFNFGGEDEQAVFDLQTEVRIAPDGSTYDVGDEWPAGVLVFENCTFTHFPRRLFYALEVSELDMRSCGIRYVYGENFSTGAEKLVILLLSDNEIEDLPAGSFRGAGNLQFLFLSRNRLGQLHERAFENLKELQHLDLTENRLEALPPGIFRDLKSLRDVGLADNLLAHIDSDLFAHNPILLSVSLPRNRLTKVGEYAFRSQHRRIFSIDLSHNPQLAVLHLTVNASNLEVRNCSLESVNLYGSVARVDLSHNRLQELYMVVLETLESLVLRNNSLDELASSGKVLRLPRLRHLDVADNPLRGPVGWHTPLLETLVLRNTGQVELPLESIQAMPNLRMLDISANNLTDIDPSAFATLSQLTHFFIHNNNWNCFSLRALMDVVIRPNGITFTVDSVDPDFPGEYIHGIACMYYMPEKESLDSSSSSSELSASVESTQKPGTSDPSEVDKLRQELRSVVQHFEAKFDSILAQLGQLNERMQAIERLNQTVWSQVTLMV